MKFLHLADLHFGKSIHGVSLVENGDQPAWAERFLKLAEELRPDAVVMAGDIYDRNAPSGDAVSLLDRVITGLAGLGIPVLMTAGNHDSGQRLSFGGRLLAKQNIHICGVLSRELPHVTLSDGHGPVTFWLMPYIFPALAAQMLEDDSIHDYDTAVRKLLAAQEIDFTQRNVLAAHQNVTVNGQEVGRGGSESMVGGVGQVDYTAFDGFDYVALGHIHAAYPVGRDSVRYAGSPLCYHFTETRQARKGPLLVELGAKGQPPVITTQIIPALHPMREIRGAFAEIRAAELAGERRGEYLRIVLTDRRPEPEDYRFFRELYESRGSVLMELVSEYRQFRDIDAPPAGAAGEKSVEELFLDFYAERCGSAPGIQEQALLQFAGEQLRMPEGALLERQARAMLEYALKQEGTV